MTFIYFSKIISLLSPNDSCHTSDRTAPKPAISLLHFPHLSLRHLPGRLKRWSILSTAPMASANSHLSLKSCVYTLPANSNTLLPDTVVSFLESMHQYPDGRHHHRSVVPEKGSLPIPIVYRWLQPWMDYRKGHQSSASLTKPQRCCVVQAMKQAGSQDE